MDFKKIARCALPVIAIGMLLVIIYIILQTLPSFLSGPNDLIKTIITVYSYAMLPIFFLLYFWAGIRGMRRYGLDEISCGLVAAFSAVLIGLVQLVLEAILTLLIVSRIVTVTDFRPASAVFSSVFLGNTSGVPGVGITTICGLGIIALSAIVCFLIGVLGAIATKR